MKNKPNKLNKFSLYLSILFLIGMAAFRYLKYIPPALAYIYFGASIITFIIYAIDKFKSQAKEDIWRIPESKLHTLSLLGGWPGAAIAQQLLRHKSQKRPFRIIYWITVAANLAILSWWLSPYGSEFLN